jgi:hypothetical protein
VYPGAGALALALGRRLLCLLGELIGLRPLLLREALVALGGLVPLGGLGLLRPLLVGVASRLRGVDLGLVAVGAGPLGQPFVFEPAACAHSAADHGGGEDRHDHDDDDQDSGHRNLLLVNGRLLSLSAGWCTPASEAETPAGFPKVWIGNLSGRSGSRTENERRNPMTIVGILVVIILVLLVIYLIRRV